MPAEHAVRPPVTTEIIITAPHNHGSPEFATSILRRAGRRYKALSNHATVPKKDSAIRELRSRLSSMNDAELLRFGFTAVFRLGLACRSEVPSVQEYLALRESRAEWQRRYRGSVIEHSF